MPFTGRNNLFPHFNGRCYNNSSLFYQFYLYQFQKEAPQDTGGCKIWTKIKLCQKRLKLYFLEVFTLFLTEKGFKILKKMILNNELHTKRPLAGGKTQQI